MIDAWKTEKRLPALLCHTCITISSLSIFKYCLPTLVKRASIPSTRTPYYHNHVLAEKARLTHGFAGSSTTHWQQVSRCRGLISRHVLELGGVFFKLYHKPVPSAFDGMVFTYLVLRNIKISKNTRHHWDDVRKIRITSATESHRILTPFSSEDIDKRETVRQTFNRGRTEDPITSTILLECYGFNTSQSQIVCCARVPKHSRHAT
jgi:hypothetical protein